MKHNNTTKNSLPFNPVALADIPSIYKGRMNAVMECVRAFHNSDDDAWEIPVVGYKDAASLVNALYTATKREGLAKAVRVIQRSGRVFLVRVSALLRL